MNELKEFMICKNCKFSEQEPSGFYDCRCAKNSEYCCTFDDFSCEDFKLKDNLKLKILKNLTEI